MSIASPRSRVPLLEPRSSTLSDPRSRTKRACCRERLTSGTITSEGGIRPTTTAAPTTAPTTAAPTTAPAAPATTTAATRYYLSLGDSYASGYQPGGNTTAGFAYQVAADTQASAHPLELWASGERVGPLPAELTIVREALRVMAPRSPS